MKWLFFHYEKNVKDIEYYEILENLMERWEYETVEFKEAKSNYDTDKIGRYFSALSNEANLEAATVRMANFWCK